VVSFVTPGELQELEEISADRGVSLSAVIHSLLVRSLDEHRGSHATGDEVHDHTRRST